MERAAHHSFDPSLVSPIHAFLVMPRKITAMLSDKVSLECNAFHCPGGRIAWLQLPRGGLNAIPVWPGVEKVSLVATNALNGSEMECICQHNSTCLARFTINVVGKMCADAGIICGRRNVLCLNYLVHQCLSAYPGTFVRLISLYACVVSTTCDPAAYATSMGSMQVRRKSD